MLMLVVVGGNHGHVATLAEGGLVRVADGDLYSTRDVVQCLLIVGLCLDCDDVVLRCDVDFDARTLGEPAWHRRKDVALLAVVAPESCHGAEA